MKLESLELRLEEEEGSTSASNAHPLYPQVKLESLELRLEEEEGSTSSALDAVRD